MDTVNYLLKESFYMPLLWLTLLLIALIISLYKIRNEIFTFLPIYFCASLTQAIIFYFHSEEEIGDQSINEITIFIFTIIEVAVFLNIIYKATRSPKLKRLVIHSCYCFGLFCIWILVLKGISERTLVYQFLAESIVLLSPYVIYLLELYKLPPTFLLHKEPTFWVITGVLFFIVGTAPLVLIEFYILKTHIEIFQQLQLINYTFYSLLTLMIIKGYLCIIQPKK
jgi:hypothetical protein